MSKKQDVLEAEARLAAMGGIPAWWAQALLGLGLTPAQCVAYATTARRDPTSSLVVDASEALCADLRERASERGIDVAAVLPREEGGDVAPRCMVTVRAVLDVAEQERVLQEVGSYATVVFKPGHSFTRSAHAVARAVRLVHGVYLKKLVPAGARVLEVGANVVAMARAGVRSETYHGSCPVLTMRDSVRHAVKRDLEAMVASPRSSDVQKTTARGMLDAPERYYCSCTAEDCDWQAEYIVSNESTHDIPFDHLPAIMARHSARVWLGFMARAPGAGAGVRRGGEGHVMGFRWALAEGGKIRFHFRDDSNFGYAHDFQEWRAYGERVDYRWSGVHFDYVYTHLPVSTADSLGFAVFRVPKGAGGGVSIPYVPTGLGGMVEVTSVRVVGGASAAPLRLAEHVFQMERLAYDKALEYRRALGTGGTLATTIGYLRSVRVRFFLNGVEVGVAHPLQVETLDAAAVAIEVLAADSRGAAARDVVGLRARVDEANRAAGVGGVSLALWAPLWVSARRVFSRLSGITWETFSRRLQAIASGTAGVTVRVRTCEEFEPLAAREAVCETPAERLERYGTGCVCDEAVDVRATLAYSRDMSRGDVLMMEKYLAELLAQSVACTLHAREGDFCDEFVDADSGYASTETADEVSETCVASDTGECASAGISCASRGDSGSVGRDEEKGKGKGKEKEDGPRGAPAGAAQATAVVAVRETVEEYAAWADFCDKAAEEEARVNAYTYFQGGSRVPGEEELRRASSPRLEHYLVKVKGGVIDKVVGTRDPSLSVIMCPRRGEFFRVRTQQGSSKRMISEDVDGVYYSSSQLRIMNGRDLAGAARAALGQGDGSFAGICVTYTNGIFGGGKTREICAKLSAAVAAGDEVLYVSATVASAEQVRRKVFKKGDPRGTRDVRTMDSYLLHGSREPFVAEFGELSGEKMYSRLFVDEAPMAHWGQVVAVALRSRAREVHMWGDTNQVKFIPRTTMVSSARSSIPRSLLVRKLYDGHRCPFDTLAAWLDVYDGEARACSCCPSVRSIRDSWSFSRIASVADVPRRKGARYLVCTQYEKLLLHSTLGFEEEIEVLRVKEEDGLATVHEDQGGTHDHVIYVRAVARYDEKKNKWSPSIYNSRDHAVTASTRHRLSFSIYTVSIEEDELTKRYRASLCPLRRAVVLGEKSWASVEMDVVKCT